MDDHEWPEFWPEDAVSWVKEQAERIASLEAQLAAHRRFVRADDRWHGLDDANYGPECDVDKEGAWNDRAAAREALGDTLDGG